MDERLKSCPLSDSSFNTLSNKHANDGLVENDCDRSPPFFWNTWSHLRGGGATSGCDGDAKDCDDGASDCDCGAKRGWSGDAKKGWSGDAKDSDDDAKKDWNGDASDASDSNCDDGASTSDLRLCARGRGGGGCRLGRRGRSAAT